METIFINQDNLAYWQEKAKSIVMALGFFDGIHKGHCKVISAAAEMARNNNLSLAVMSFFPHPKSVLSNQKVHYLMPLSEKEEKLRQLGVDTFYVVEFNKEFASLQPEEFVSHYLINLGVVHAVAGFDYTYGFKGAGNMETLKNDSGGLIDVTKVDKLEFRGEKISSTCIRERLLTGKVDELPSLLGEPYKIKGEWDGHTLTHKPFYTLPAPGCYGVTIQNELRSVHTRVAVLETGAGHVLKCMAGIPKYMIGNLSIIWHRSIEEFGHTPTHREWLINNEEVKSIQYV